MSLYWAAVLVIKQIQHQINKCTVFTLYTFNVSSDDSSAVYRGLKVNRSSELCSKITPIIQFHVSFFCKKCFGRILNIFDLVARSSKKVCIVDQFSTSPMCLLGKSPEKHCFLIPHLFSPTRLPLPHSFLFPFQVWLSIRNAEVVSARKAQH